MSQHYAGGLLSKNIRIHKRRTSIRLEETLWGALHEITRIEECTISDLCSAVADLKEESGSLTSSIRTFIVEYWRPHSSQPRVAMVREIMRKSGVNIEIAHPGKEQPENQKSVAVSRI